MTTHIFCRKICSNINFYFVWLIAFCAPQVRGHPLGFNIPFNTILEKTLQGQYLLTKNGAVKALNNEAELNDKICLAVRKKISTLQFKSTN